MIDGSFDGDRTVAAVRDSRYVCNTTKHGGVRVNRVLLLTPPSERVIFIYRVLFAKHL